jgi:NADH dehydrogenase
MWAALGAARVLDQHGRGDVEVALVAPEPLLHLRPRLHEAAPHAMTTPLLPLFEAAGVRYVQGNVERIHTGERSVEAVNARGERFTLAYDRLC